MTEREQGSARWLLPVGLGVAVVALVTVALTRGPVELDPGTPESTVQQYLVSIDEKRWADAVAVIHPQWLGACDGDDLARSADFEFTAELGEVGVEERDVIGASPDTLSQGDFPEVDEHVEVTISRNDSPVFGPGWEERVLFEMVDEDAVWWVSGDPWPYFIWSCRGV